MAIKNIKAYFWSPVFATAIAFFILASLSWLLTKSISRTDVQPQKPPSNITTATNIQTPIATPSVTVIVKGKRTTTTVTTIPLATPASVPSSRPTNSPQPQVIGTTAAQTTNLQLTEPDGIFNVSLNFQSGSNPCSILNEAKSEGKIKSVTITHYGPPLNSDYVKEINNYSDNWTFALDGTVEPKGCSNYTISPGDSINWKYN